jgi:peptidyl-prolyl cis-trans isomerase B (cyclophilin B)
LATAGPDTGGSQYYLCHSTQPHLDGGYTVFGQVVDGFDVMDRIVRGDRMLQVRVP